MLPDVGIVLKKIQGDAVQEGETLCLIHGRDAERISRARSLRVEAYSLGAQERQAAGSGDGRNQGR